MQNYKKKKKKNSVTSEIKHGASSDTYPRTQSPHPRSQSSDSKTVQKKNTEIASN